MTPVTKKHQQLILLEPDKAKLLDELATETRITKQVLLREAVDDLLAKHGKGKTAWYEDIIGAMQMAKAVAAGHLAGRDVTAKCHELRNVASGMLAALGRK